MNYILKLEPVFKDKSNKAKFCLSYRFLQKYNFVLRKASHIGQPLSLDYENKITVFLKDLISKWRELKIDKNNLYLLINTDETPAFFDAPFDTTLDIKGKKEIKIQTSSYEKERLSVVLSWAANGERLPPLIIFKGILGKRIEKDLSKNELVKTKRLYAFCQQNAWCTCDICKIWIKEIYLKYQNKIKSKCLLFLNWAPSHKNEDIITFMYNNNVDISLSLLD